MKKHFTTSMLTIGFILLLAQSAAGIPNSGVQVISKSDPIDLRGDLDPGPGLRSGSGAITAEVRGDAIAVTFHKDVDELLITITDVSGTTVYTTTVNTSVQQQLLIPLSGLSSGTYTITFSNDRGEMRGEFEVN